MWQQQQPLLVFVTHRVAGSHLLTLAITCSLPWGPPDSEWRLVLGFKSLYQDFVTLGREFIVWCLSFLLQRIGVILHPTGIIPIQEFSEKRGQG